MIASFLYRLRHRKDDSNFTQYKRGFGWAMAEHLISGLPKEKLLTMVCEGGLPSNNKFFIRGVSLACKKLLTFEYSIPHSSRTGVYRDYWSNGHRPYRNLIIGLDGSDKAEQHGKLSELFEEAEVKDGDEIIVSIFKTGVRPYGDRRVIWQRAHTYGLETDEQYRKRTGEEPGQ